VTWRVRTATAADEDFDVIVLWTEAAFSAAQAEEYAARLSAAIAELCEGPASLRAKPIKGPHPNLVTVRVARRRRKSSHLFLCQVRKDEKLILVLRILHERMDVRRHIPDRIED